MEDMQDEAPAPIRIDTPLSHACELVDIWSKEPSPREALVLFHPDAAIVRRLIARASADHRFAQVVSDRTWTIPQMAASVCRALGLEASRKGYESFTRITQHGGAIHFTDAHLLKYAHLEVIVDLTKDRRQRVLLSSTNPKMVELICGCRGRDGGAHPSHFLFPRTTE